MKHVRIKNVFLTIVFDHLRITFHHGQITQIRIIYGRQIFFHIRIYSRKIFNVREKAPLHIITCEMQK